MCLFWCYGIKKLFFDINPNFFTDIRVELQVGPSGKVTGVDHIKGLVEDSIVNVNNWDHKKHKSANIELITHDGRLGFPENAPYDAIHVGAAADTIPHQVNMCL